jgi:hypothetical protein
VNYLLRFRPELVADAQAAFAWFIHGARDPSSIRRSLRSRTAAD